MFLLVCSSDTHSVSQLVCGLLLQHTRIIDSLARGLEGLSNQIVHKMVDIERVGPANIEQCDMVGGRLSLTPHSLSQLCIF